MTKSKFLHKIKFIAAGGITLFSLWCIFSCSNVSEAQEEYEKYIKVDSLNANAIIVHLASDAVTAISTTKGIVVIDAGISISLTAKYRKIIESKFKRKDFACLINTHAHPDHTGGNQVFNDATIVGHKNCLPEMTGYWKNKEKIKSRLSKIVSDYEKEIDTLTPDSFEWEERFCQMSRYQCAYSDLTPGHIFTPPSISFHDSLDLTSGDITFNLIYFGNAHSISDIVIHIPEMKMLMVGDLFSKYGRPNISDTIKTDVERWIKVLKWIEPRLTNIDIVVGGHGQIMSKEDLLLFNSFVKKSADK
jgi:cyclase